MYSAIGRVQERGHFGRVIGPIGVLEGLLLHPLIYVSQQGALSERQMDRVAWSTDVGRLLQAK